MLGNPQFKRGDIVRFRANDVLLEGSVYIVDSFGTFEYTEDVSYDVMVGEGEHRCLYKHIPEKDLEV